MAPVMTYVEKVESEKAAKEALLHPGTVQK